MKKLFFLLFIGILFSCDNQTNTTNNDASNDNGTAQTDDSKIGRKNFAAIWHWITTDEKLVADNAETMTAELMDLWQNDDIENAYFNMDATDQMLGDFVNISFLIKAKTIKVAENKLNKLTVVKKGIADYILVPVGIMWLDRNAEVIKEKGIHNTYVAVWETAKDGSPGDELIKAQSDAILDLWNNGTIENVYFDIEGTQKDNEITDFVFYVNAKSEKEANKICSNLPFVKKNIANYKIFPVGVFWIGKYKE